MTTEEKITVMQGWLSGKILQTRYLPGQRSINPWVDWEGITDEEPVWQFDRLEYRIKPEPKTVPFTRETIPLRAIFKNKKSDRWYFITILDADWVAFGDKAGATFRGLMDEFVYSLDDGKTWATCSKTVE